MLATSARTDDQPRNLDDTRVPPKEFSSASIRLLRGFAVDVDGRLVELPCPAQRVVAFVALHDGPVARTSVASRLWLDRTESHARGSLRTALYHIRQLAGPLLECSNSRLALAPRVEVDARALLVWSCRIFDGTATPQDQSVDRIRAGGELLPDWYQDDWIVLERERLREVRIRALEALSEQLTRDGAYHGAIEAALAAISEDYLRESAHRALVKVHLAEGNVAEALRRYRIFRELLHRELGLEPTTQMADLLHSAVTR